MLRNLYCRKSEVAKTRFFRPRGQANFLTHNFYFYEFYYQFRPMTNTSPDRSPWTTLNKPTLSSCRVNILPDINHSLDPMVLLWVKCRHVHQTNVGSVRSEEQRVQLGCKKIYGKVETVRLWRSVVGKLVLLWVTFNAIEAVCHCTSSNFGVSWCCCGRSVVKSVKERADKWAILRPFHWERVH